ncbi:MAG: electron transfer flavoprotein subunit alpha/FixB family protein [Acidilobaceae archaeon]|nr:electron transfer flavoprotein subunit alpha/FixB family protein [Acidilobaceae archaeon]MCX8165880.1 electron transfer flavoprotein subunit alpha/FixB family protein [Acidilobaceae archaeon]MDW7974522.1 electron transfer flavoprotein subunit alpha/FixB family protein [Sulfolobales archaeon]
MMKMDCEKLCPEWPCEPPEEYKDVWVVVEAEEGKLSEASLQMLTPGRAIADKLKENLVGVLLGYGVSQLAEEVIKYGADRVIVVDDERLSTYYPRVYGSAVVELAKKYKPSVILVAGTRRGREFAPYVANSLKAGITADCTDFDVDETTRDVLLIRPPFAAILLAYIKTPFRRPQIGTARPNVFPVPKRDEGRRGEVVLERVEIGQESRMKLISRRKVEKARAGVEKASVIVSGGRGIGGPEGMEMLRRLAELLGGTVGASRKAVDAGWADHEMQVGQTGKSVKPILYLAVGISGSAQHMLGVREAQRIVAINIDPEASIFSQADYSVVGDYREVVPALIEELEKIRKGGVKALREILES